ncbi:ketoacyl-ACP synthase III [Pelagibius sp.]|uniref:ketoacyl-ACP synthase III n=1 Tax=Pelagibius sp. TaxID=1931238 RepID=UPI003BAF9CC5
MSLEAIASALPSIRQDAAEVARLTGAKESFIKDKVGLKQRYILAPEETGVGLAAAACEKLMAAKGLKPEAVDVLIFVTQTPDRKLPQNSAQLAQCLGLKAGLAAFDLALGCSGYVYGLQVVESFLAATGCETALLVTCDPYSRIMAAEDTATNAVFGDAATASLVLRRGDRSRLGITDFGTDGGGGEAIRIDAGAAQAPSVALQVDDVAAHDRDALRLKMNGREVFNFVMTRIPVSIETCLARNGLALDEVDCFACHQGSLYMLQSLAKRAGIPPEKLLINIDRYGNTVSSTIPMLLEAQMANGSMAGKTVLVSGFGVGLSWATSVIRFGS